MFIEFCHVCSGNLNNRLQRQPEQTVIVIVIIIIVVVVIVVFCCALFVFVTYSLQSTGLASSVCCDVQFVYILCTYRKKCFWFFFTDDI